MPNSAPFRPGAPLLGAGPYQNGGFFSPPVPFDHQHVEPRLTTHLRSILAEYASVDNLTGPRPLLAMVPAQLGFIEQLLCDAGGDDRRELLDVGARCAELVGWLSQDAGDLRAADYWSDRAMDYALALRDQRLLSYVLMRKSNLASDGRDAERALDLARQALHEWDRLTPRLRAVALRQEAHAHALRGDTAACARSLDRAMEQATSGRTGEPELDLTAYCTPSYLGMEAAACWVQLGQPHRAVATLEQGLSSWPPEYKRDLRLCLARLALAHAAAGDAEQAYRVAQRALGIVKDTRSARTLRELWRLDTWLANRRGLPAGMRLEGALAGLA
ncbi:MAG: XRE family transcriptional regulator [Chloroflexota bacterium]